MSDILIPTNFVWRSGDFVIPPRKQPPFNGVEIRAVSTYDQAGALSLLALTVEDFTNNNAGQTVTHTFEPARSGEALQLKPQGDFTVNGSVELRLTSALPTDIVIFIDVSYGLPENRHHADGGILAIPLAGPPTVLEGRSTAPTPSELDADLSAEAICPPVGSVNHEVELEGEYSFNIYNSGTSSVNYRIEWALRVVDSLDEAEGHQDGTLLPDGHNQADDLKLRLSFVPRDRGTYQVEAEITAVYDTGVHVTEKRVCEFDVEDDG